MSFNFHAVPNKTSERVPTFLTPNTPPRAVPILRRPVLPDLLPHKFLTTRHFTKKALPPIVHLNVCLIDINKRINVNSTRPSAHHALLKARKDLRLLKSKMKTLCFAGKPPQIAEEKRSTRNQKEKETLEDTRFRHTTHVEMPPVRPYSKFLPTTAPSSLLTNDSSTLEEVNFLNASPKFISKAKKIRMNMKQITAIIEFVNEFEICPYKPISLENATHISRREAEEIRGSKLPFSMTRSLNEEWFVHLKTKNGPLLGEGSFKRVKTSLSYSSGKIVANATGYTSKPVIRNALLRDSHVGKMFTRQTGLVSVISSVQYRGSLGQNKTSILMPYYNMGDLKSNFGMLSPVNQFRVAKDIIGGLATLHRLDITHRDIKPQNIFIKRSRLGLVSGAIGDFGTCHLKNLENPHTHGTPVYLSTDQMVEGDEERNALVRKASDVYALGIVILELFHMPLPEMLDEKIIKTKFRSIISYLGNKFNLTDSESAEYRKYQASLNVLRSMHFEDKKEETLVRLATSCLDINPLNRPTAEDMLAQFT